MTTAVPVIEFGSLFTQLGGGLALFLYGMRRMTESLKTVAGSDMKNLLARLTTNRFTATLAGVLVTAVIQSSSVTTVLVVGFVSAGLLNVGQSIGVILGANVGTTITAQIVAFAVYKYGLLMIAVGFFTNILARREKVRQWAMVLLGLGLIFFGMELMSIATGPLRQWPPFIDLMLSMGNPLLAALLGTVFTAIVQSSSATTGIVIVLASQGLITLETGIGLLFGANIGTCITAFISAIGRPRGAMQAAWVHIVFNVGGVLLWIFFVPQFADFVRALSPASEHLQGLQRLAAETPRQIANAHTVFNVVNLLLFIWFTGPMARLVDRLVPEKPKAPGIQPLYLNEFFLEEPGLALDQARRELVRLGGMIQQMLSRAMHVAASGTHEEAEAISKMDDDVDTIYGEIIRFLGRLSQKNLVQPKPQQLSRYVGIANYLENMGDVIEKDLLGVMRKRLALGVAISPSTLEALRPIADKMCQAYDQALNALKETNLEDALEAIESKSVVNELVEEASAHIAKRLVADEPDRLVMFHIEADIIENYRRLNTYTRRIAKLTLEAFGDQAIEDEPANSVAAEG
jgi:phosphate:Na+ symporter